MTEQGLEKLIELPLTEFLGSGFRYKKYRIQIVGDINNYAPAYNVFLVYHHRWYNFFGRVIFRSKFVFNRYGMEDAHKEANRLFRYICEIS